MTAEKESNLTETIRLLNETANMDLVEWAQSKDWLGRSEKDAVALEEKLRDLWNLGRNVILLWAELSDSIQLLAVPQYVVAKLADDSPSESEGREISKGLLSSNKHVSIEELEEAASTLSYKTININIGTRTWRLDNEVTNDIVKRYGTNYAADHAVALFDIVGFSLYSPLEQVTQLNSLSYSLNSAYARLLTKESDLDFARSTTGDGFYVWSRDDNIQANINLYHFMHLALADNAIARSKSQGNVTPELRAAFHVGSHYEFYQSEKLSPINSSYIVGDATIELARMVDQAKPGQVLVGDFRAPMLDEASGETVYVDTQRFIDLTQETLSSLEGLVLSGEKVDAIRCYLTGDKVDGEFTVRPYEIRDKHGFTRKAYNAKINIYRGDADPIYLGLQDAEVQLD